MICKSISDILKNSFNIEPPRILGNKFYSKISLGQSKTQLLYQSSTIQNWQLNESTSSIILTINKDISQFKEHISRKIIQNKTQWFSSDSDITMSFLQRMFENNNELQCKLPDKQILNDKSKYVIYNKSKERKDITDLKNAKSMICILHIKGLIMTSTNLELDININQIMILDQKSKVQVQFNGSTPENIEDKKGYESESDDELELEFDTDISDNEIIKIKQPNEIYYELYIEALKVAYRAHKIALKKMEEASLIQKSYGLRKLSFDIFEKNDDNGDDDDDDMEDD